MTACNIFDSSSFSFEIIDGAQVTEIIDTQNTHGFKGWQQATSRSLSTYWLPLIVWTSNFICFVQIVKALNIASTPSRVRERFCFSMKFDYLELIITILWLSSYFAMKLEQLIIQYLSVSRVEMQKYLNCRPKFLSIRHLCVTLSVTLFLLLLFHYGGCTQVYLSIYVNFEIIKNDLKNFFISDTDKQFTYTT